jgi:hypothetical protein
MIAPVARRGETEAMAATRTLKKMLAGHDLDALLVAADLMEDDGIPSASKAGLSFTADQLRRAARMAIQLREHLTRANVRMRPRLQETLDDARYPGVVFLDVAGGIDVMTAEVYLGPVKRVVSCKIRRKWWARPGYLNRRCWEVGAAVVIRADRHIKEDSDR